MEDKNRELAKLSQVSWIIMSTKILRNSKQTLKLPRWRPLILLTQERQKETSHLERGLVNARDELLTARRQVTICHKLTGNLPHQKSPNNLISILIAVQVDDLEKEKEGLEEKIKELTRLVEEKTVDILVLSKEKKTMEQENSGKIAELILEKEKLMEDQKKVVLKLISDGQKEKEKTIRDIAMLKKDVEERDEKCNQLRIRLVEGERTIEKKSEELELVRVGQEEIRKRNEFRSNLEKSFESLQKQFQAKVDELERLKRELGHDDNKRRRTSNEIRHTSER